jgi:hypothetical protein
MTIHRYLNQYGLGGNHTSWWLFKCMVDAGWTVPLSGSGTGGLYSAGNVFDMTQSPKQNSLKGSIGVGVGSEAWGHARCWVVLEDPSGNRQIVFQRDSVNADGNDDEWYFGYSYGGRFGEGQVGGVDYDAQVAALAPDQYNLWGSPTGWSAIFESGGAGSLVHVAADDTPSPRGEYGVLMIEMSPTNTQSAIVMLDDVRGGPVGHPHPLAIYVDGNDSVLTVNNIGGTTSPRYAKTVLDPGGPGETFIQMNAARPRYANVDIVGAWGLGQDNAERIVPFMWGFAGNEVFLGLSRWLRWAAISRGYPSTAGSRQFLYLNQAVIEDLWDGSTVPVAI